MIPIAHRGLWAAQSEQNTEKSFIDARKLNFGIETDIRDWNGDLVISHDVPNSNPDLLLQMIRSFSPERPVALNIKSDGLVLQVKRIIEAFPNYDFFTFDMSVPETRRYLEADIPVFTRASDVETMPIWLDDAVGVWVDAFENDNWYDVEQLLEWAEIGKRICIVSPELHAREFMGVWEKLNTFFKQFPESMLCTDRPHEARMYFGVAS